MRNKILWSNETKIELFGLKFQALNLEETCHHWYGEAWCQHHAVGMFFSSRETSQDWGRNERSKVQRDPWFKNLLQSTQDLRLGQRFTFQQDNNPKHTAKTMHEWFLSLNVLEWPSQSPDLNYIEHHWRDLKIALQQRHPPANLTERERICSEEREKLPKYRCAKLVASYPRKLKAVIAAKVASTKYWVHGLNT